jgi:2,5-diamino-6-(ribosylamino)-4(3H)-pyrimidinone 5'-phosphate reductase
MKRPHVIINCAMSADGKIALPSGRQLHISCDEDIARMYKLRNESDAVLVGIGTVLSDDPKLTVKEKYVEKPHQPIRVILDTHCKTPENAFAVNETVKTIIITAEPCKKTYGDNVEVIQCQTDDNGFIDLHYMLSLLGSHGIKTLMVEGGSTVIWNFLKHKLVDEIYVYLSPIIVGGKHTPTMAGGEGIDNLNEVVSLEIVETQRVGPGLLIHYKLIP